MWKCRFTLCISFGFVTPISLVKPAIFLLYSCDKYVDSPECLSGTTVNKQRFLVASSLHPHYNPVIKQLGVRECVSQIWS